MEFGVVTSLLGIVEQQLILHPHRCLILLPADTQIIIESLTHKLRFLQAFLQKSDPKAQKVLHQGIRDVAAKAEDKIESKLSDVYLAAEGEHAASVEAACEDLHHTLQQVVRDIESVEVGVRYHLQQQKQTKPHTSSSLDSDDDASSSETPSSSLQHIRDGGFSTNYLEPDENVMIGLEDGFKKIYWNGMPSEIVNLIHLRHVHLDKGSSLDLPSSLQENLQTLFWLKVASWDSKPLDFTRVPNLKELGIYIEGEVSSDALDGLAQLYCLEKLKFELGRVEHFCLPISFPPNLKKLTLCKTYLPWEEMDIIGKLPNLEVLKLKDFAFCGPLWKPSAKTFHRLKFLLVAHSDLEHWDVDKDADVFPDLECLSLRRCWKNCKWMKARKKSENMQFDYFVIEQNWFRQGSLYNFQLLKLKNLQTLVVHSWREEDRLQLPINILDLPLLRHAHLSKRAALYLPNMVQQRLQSLYWVKVANVNQEINFERVPKLKELGIYIDDKLPHGALDSLVHLKWLEKLKFEVGRAERFSLPAALSPNLKTLSLRYTYLPWKQMDIIGKLPCLEVLKLKDFAFCGSKWNPSEEGFKNLKLFLIARSDLKHWNATSEHFPVLKRLVLKNCWDLVSIPNDFAGIYTLESIELESCYSSLVKFAEEIKEQLQDFGIDLLVRKLGIKDKSREEESETEEEDSEGSDDVN
nr:putative late blight resistance protein homolog R1B-14 [Ipomoea batatas]